MSASFLNDILSVPALDQYDFQDGLDVSAMDLEAFAFRRGGKDASMCGAGLYDTTAPPVWAATPPSAVPQMPHVADSSLVPSWNPHAQQQLLLHEQLQQLQRQRQLLEHAGNQLEQQEQMRSRHLLTHQDSASSDEGFATEDSAAASPPAATSPPRQRKTPTKRPASPPAVALSPGAELEAEMTAEDDLAGLEDDMAMSPEEEARLRSLLARRQVDLENCTSKMKGLTPQNKKRLRNRHASCVSRLKKKLYICNLQRDLERARAVISGLQADVEAQNGTIAFFRRENDRLCAQVRSQEGTAVVGQAASN